jgi:hypothetical protein
MLLHPDTAWTVARLERDLSLERIAKERGWWRAPGRAARERAGWFAVSALRSPRGDGPTGAEDEDAAQQGTRNRVGLSWAAAGRAMMGGERPCVN